MEYNLIINEETIPIEANTDGEQTLKVIINDILYHVCYTWISEYQLSLSVNGKRTNAYISPNGSGKNIIINGISEYIEDADTLARLKPGNKKGADLPDSVTPPMPAIVIAVMVEPGDMVEKGQAVVVVSAMKMETSLKAPYSGTVHTVNTSEGEKVNPGDVLVNIDPGVKEDDEEEQKAVVSKLL